MVVTGGQIIFWCWAVSKMISLMAVLSKYVMLRYKKDFFTLNLQLHSIQCTVQGQWVMEG